ncbi:hypothetical protein AB1K54_17165 [Microbacterium sp. BWT-B31]|uniref:hypothetical protein n=1 Tax=Microbacterium sp. BWT-B31 TaxID=3232072 RepID=UPI0035272DA5
MRSHRRVHAAPPRHRWIDRVAANRVNAQDRITRIDRILATDPDRDDERVARLRKEAEYLERVVAGTVQLYLYDHDASRIIEMIGAPSATTTTVVTSGPGTYTSLFNFYDGGVQQVSKHLTDKVPGTIAFVYKDGLFPGEDTATGGMNALRIGEANDADRARSAGKQLASFEAGMRSDPVLGAARQVAIGHSWGLANVTSSEVAGAHYDKVVSLSGAGMLPEWQKNPQTTYLDLSFRDILQSGQGLGVVWDGNNPRTNPAFEHGEYYRGPDDKYLDPVTVHTMDGPVTTYDGRALGVLVDNHNLITQNTPSNFRVLFDLQRWLDG